MSYTLTKMYHSSSVIISQRSFCSRLSTPIDVHGAMEHCYRTLLLSHLIICTTLFLVDFGCGMYYKSFCLLNFFFVSLYCCCCCCFSHSAHWLPTRKNYQVLYKVANPARGLLNREKKESSAPPPPRALCSFGEKNKKNKKITRRIHISRRYASRRYAGGLGPSRICTRIPTTRQLGHCGCCFAKLYASVCDCNFLYDDQCNKCIQHNGGLLPDIILLTKCYYRWGTPSNVMKMFCLCSL